jgi:hypothetical protein
LLRDPVAAGAQCDAQGHLFPARSCARKQQVGDIGARNQQHHSDRGQKRK